MQRRPVSISFSQEELKDLDQLAKKFHQTRSALLKMALQEYIRKFRFARLREMGQVIARSKGFFTDEDIFREVS